LLLKGTNFKYGTTHHRNFLHMTGGLRGGKTTAGWLIAPFPSETEPRHIGPIPDAQFVATCEELGVRLFGGDEVNDTDPLLPTRVWTPLLGQPLLSYQPADTWTFVEHSARTAGDNDYAALAQNVSVSFRAAGIRLRDASDQIPFAARFFFA
jgi:hypothetical protein